MRNSYFWFASVGIVGLLVFSTGCSDVNACGPGQLRDDEGLCREPCELPGVTCDDGNDCTSDSCNDLPDATYECSNLPEPDDTSCTRGDDAGRCVSGECDLCAEVSCNDDNDCTVDGACNAETGGCPAKAPASAGTPCGDGGVCDGGGNCGACTENSECSDDNPCTGGICDGGVCTTPPVDGAVCDFTAPGSRDGQCKDGVCEDPGASCQPNPCNDGNQCTQNVCEPDGLDNYTCAHPPSPRGSTCSQDGGTRCDGASNCVQCIDATPCGDGNQCTKDICTSEGVCTHPQEPQGTSCNQDGGTRCNASGNCVECTSADHCSDGNECTGDVCESDGACSNPFMDLVPCSLMPGSGLCSGGVCVDPAQGDIQLSIDLSTTVLTITSFEPYEAEVVNLDQTQQDVFVQGWIDQGAASRAAGGGDVTCGGESGELPPGTCTFNRIVVVSNSGAGTGTLVPGAAMARFELRQDDGGGGTTLLDVVQIPVTLIAP